MRRRHRWSWRGRCAALLTLGATAHVAAEPERASPQEPPGAPASGGSTSGQDAPAARREITAADVAGAPLPGHESGRIDAPAGGDSLLRRGARAVLFVPKLAVIVVLSPVRFGIWAFDRYRLYDLYRRVFFNEDLTIGLVPTAEFESGFGINVGARFVHTDLFGAGEHLSLRVSTGGRYQQVYSGRLRSGRRIGERLELEIGGGYEIRPKDPFYGIGNHDETEQPPPGLIDPLTSGVAVETRFRERIARGMAIADVRVAGPLHLRSSSELSDRTFDSSDEGVPIDEVYDPMALVGFADGVRHTYTELELRYDSRGRVTRLEPLSFYARGSLVAVFAGFSYRLDELESYWRYGIDLQHFVRLAEGPRVLALRMRGEAVTGGRTEVPFMELPQLGGAEDLRGYPTDRFRDRVAALASVEYGWDLSEWVSASLYVDAGRVFPSLDDLSFDDFRVGYGGALQVHSDRSFGAQASLSSSIDGGLFLNLTLNPVFGIDERVRRR